MTRKEQRDKRPEGWEEVKAAYNRRELTFAQAAEKLGISGAWFNILLRRDEPGRKGFKEENAKAMGLANRKFSTYLQQNFSDYELCMMIKSRNKCDKCPIKCTTGRSFKGLADKLVQKVSLKDAEKPLESADA